MRILFICIIVFAFTSIEGFSQKGIVDIGINFGATKANEIKRHYPATISKSQEIFWGLCYGISLKRKFKNVFVNKFQLKFNSIKKNSEVSFDAYYHNAGSKFLLYTQEGQWNHDYRTLGLNYQFSYTPIKRYPFSAHVGLSYERVVQNKSTEIYWRTNYGEFNGLSYLELDDPAEEYYNGPKIILANFFAAQIGVGYYFHFYKFEAYPSIEYYSTWGLRGGASKSWINLCIELYYKL